MTGRVLGAVLAGGASSRFGSDKAMAMLAGRTLLAHAYAALAGVVDEVVVVGRGDVTDLPHAGLGPLGGIAGALAYAEGRGFDSVMTVACDMPGVPAALLAALKERAPSCCADAPVLGHWPVAVFGDLIDRLAIPRSSPRARPGVPLLVPTTGQGSGIPAEGRGDVEVEDTGRLLRYASLSVRRWAAEIGAVAIPSPAPIANINTPADLPPP